MNNITILTVLRANPQKQDLSAALKLAQSHNAHLSFLVVEPMPTFPVYATGASHYAMAAIPDTWETDISKSLDALEAAEAKKENYEVKALAAR